MSDDLIAIIGCCVLGLVAHGARRQTWLEWVLRVTYCLFLFGEVINILSDPQSLYETPWSFGVLIGCTVGTALLLFKPGRQLYSLLFTVLNQIIGGRVFLAMLGKLEASVLVTPLRAKYVLPPSSAPGSGFPLPAPSIYPIPAPGAVQGSASAFDGVNPVSEPKVDAVLSTTTEDSSTNAGSESASDLAAAESLNTDTVLESAQSLPAEPVESAATQDEPLAVESAPDAEQLGTTATSGSEQPNAPDSGTSQASANPAPAASVMQKVSFFQSFFAERIFVAESIPHMNALWIYITCLAFLLTHMEIAGFQMPSIMIPTPVTMDQLFSYNFLGLVLLAIFGCGIFVSRSPLEVLRRLGLVKPSFTNILIGVGGIFVTFTYDWLWSFYTHGQEGMGYADKLSHYNEGTFTGAGASPGAAMMIATATGFCAGVGEETLIRGALQPVFGIIPSAFMHGVLHGQFAHAPLLILQVFGWSMIMGIIRRYTNTTTTIITHLGFNLLSTFLFAFNP